MCDGSDRYHERDVIAVQVRCPSIATDFCSDETFTDTDTGLGGSAQAYLAKPESK